MEAPSSGTAPPEVEEHASDSKSAEKSKSSTLVELILGVLPVPVNFYWMLLPTFECLRCVSFVSTGVFAYSFMLHAFVNGGLLLSKERLQPDGEANSHNLISALIIDLVMILASVLLLLKTSFLGRMVFLLVALVSFGLQATAIHASELRHEEFLKRDALVQFTTEKVYAAANVLGAFAIFFFSWTLTAYNCLTVISYTIWEAKVLRAEQK